MFGGSGRGDGGPCIGARRRRCNVALDAPSSSQARFVEVASSSRAHTGGGKPGWKWSVAVDAAGIPLGWVIDGANRNDSILLALTLDAVHANGLLGEITTLHPDRGYDSVATRQRLAAAGVHDAVIQLRGTKVPGVKKQPVRLGLRWIVEATNSWWSNYGQLRRNTDRKIVHRHTALSLATVILMVGRLIDYRDRWSPT